MCAFILCNFASRNASFMSRIFVTYIRPLLEYASQLWSPFTIDFINRIERVQRMFTKRIRSISHMTYDERLAHLNLHRSECRRLNLDKLFLGKLKYNIIHLSLRDFSAQNSTFPLCITTALSHCLLLTTYHFTFSLFALYVYGMVCTMM